MIQTATTKNYYFNPIFDRCPVIVTGQTGETAAFSFSRSTNPKHEKRYIYKTSAEFDLGQYMRTGIEDEILGSVLSHTVSASMSIAIINMFFGLAAAGLEGAEQELHFLPLFATLRDGEKMTGKRTHFYNPNFPQRLTGLSFNEAIIYRNGTRTSGSIKSVGLRDNWIYWYYDNFAPYERADFDIEVSKHAEPTKETALEAFDVEEVNLWTDTRLDRYIFDCRTSGACLRFFDHFGLVQTLVLDISSTGRDFAEQIREGYEGQSNRYNEAFGFVQGGNAARSVEVTEVIHAGLNSVPEELYGDLCDLVASPVVVLYNQQTTHWERVRVSCNSITRDEKRHKLSADIDIITTPINTLR